MRKLVSFISFASLLVLVGVSCTLLQPHGIFAAVRRPLSESEILALVAGDSLSENVAAEIQARGLRHPVDSGFTVLLTAAGADARILTALKSARVSSGDSSRQDDPALLQHLSNAGKFLHADSLDAAANELSQAVSGGNGKSEAAFVAGMILAKQGRWQDCNTVYAELLRQDPDFPLVHLRLSLAAINLEDYEEALKQAKLALAENQKNPSAHQNAALAAQRLGKIDVAKAEFQAAIQSKPDYTNAYVSFAELSMDLRDYKSAIDLLKQVLALDPNDDDSRYNLALSYGRVGDVASSIREYREVKRRDPDRFDARQNLAVELMDLDPAASITEFRELAEKNPEWPLCHICLGHALVRSGRYDDAEKEYRIAVALQPASPEPHTSLALVYETRKQFDQALEEYRQAERIDDSLASAHIGAGRVLIQKKDFSAALAELKRGEELDPANWTAHDLRGEAFEARGDHSAAISEFKDALADSPKEVLPRLNLAHALEVTGDWPAALENYRQASLDQPPPKSGAAQLFYDPAARLEEARQRFQQRLVDLRASGKSAEASALESRVKASESTAGIDEKLQSVLQASGLAISQQRFDEAEALAQEAIALAEKIQPPDGRLPDSVGNLGAIYLRRAQNEKANEQFKRQLALCEKIYGPVSPMLVMPLSNLATAARVQKNYPAAEDYYNRALELAQRSYGQNSTAAADLLRSFSMVYLAQKDYSKAESILVKSVQIDEGLYGADSLRVAFTLNALCFVYDQGAMPEKSVSCHARILTIEEKEFGAGSQYLVQDLVAEAKALRILGRNDEAAKLEKRAQAIQSVSASAATP